VSRRHPILFALLHGVLGKVLLPIIVLRWIATGGNRAVALREGRSRAVSMDRIAPAEQPRRVLLMLGLVVPALLIALGVRTIHEAAEFRAGDHFRGTVVDAQPIGPYDRQHVIVELDDPPSGVPARVEADEFDIAEGDRVTAFRDRSGTVTVDERDDYGPIGLTLLVLGVALVPGTLLVLAGRQLVFRRGD
jgi:hypothetical protein